MILSHPFQLAVDPMPNASYALTVLQRPYPERKDGVVLPFVKIGSIEGLALSSAWDIILEVLHTNHHKPTAIQHDKKKRLELNEESGIRLSLLFLALVSLSNLDHMRTLQQSIWSMSNEEAYYWFSKCSGTNGRRGVRALRILCGGVV
jgi:hypothetical protein